MVRPSERTEPSAQDLILVNQLGQRLYDESKRDPPHGNMYNDIEPYTPGDYHKKE